MHIHNSTFDQIENRNHHTISRRVLQLLALVLIPIIVIACTDAIQDPATEEDSDLDVLAITPEWIQNNVGSSALANELNEVRKATQKYKDAQKALDDGYVIISEYVPNMGFHFTNPALIAEDEDAEHDLTKPAILVYYTTGNYRPEPFEELDEERLNDLRLGAAEFAHSGDEVGAAANYFSDEEAPRNVRFPEEDGWEQIPGTPLTALHVWVHRGNPDGVFSPTNRTID